MALNKYTNEQLEKELKTRKAEKKFTFTQKAFKDFFNEQLEAKKQEWQAEQTKTVQTKQEEAKILSSALGKTVEPTETVTAEDFTNILKM